MYFSCCWDGKRIDVLDMKLIKATKHDFERITSFYRHVIADMADMDVYGKWIYGLHPTDGMLLDYIRSGVMYTCQ